MRRCLFIVALFAMAACASAPPATDPTLVRTESGLVRGERTGDISVFRGIPYAAAPEGNLRWRAPAAAAAWQGERDATKFGADCWQNRMQGDLGASGQPMSEDCLYLNVWSSVPAPGAKLPVMVWIHGGGFVGGSGAAKITDGLELARRGVVVVTLNYRLGRFGFFAYPELTREGGPTGNWGLMDQIAALQWVKRNIAGFGGDPANVTIFGESAGGESVNRLMASPEARGLFAKAIAASGGGRDGWPALPAAEAKGAAFAASVHATDLAGLRAVVPKDVLGPITLLNKDDARYSGPITDGRIVTDRADALFKAAKAAAVPYIVGANSDELGMIPAGMRKMANSAMTAPVKSNLDEIAGAYGSAETMDRRIAGDVTFVEPARAMAVRHAATGSRTYLYSFGYVAETQRAGGVGAGHATDVPYQFDQLGAAIGAPTANDQAAADLLATYWTNFAKRGDPNGDGLPQWPALAPRSPMLLVIGLEDTQASSANSPAIIAIASARDGKEQ